jgi:hypothetical protein
VDVDGSIFEMRLDDVEKANTIYHFSSADFGRATPADEQAKGKQKKQSGQVERSAGKNANRGTKASSANRARRAR